MLGAVRADAIDRRSWVSIFGLSEDIQGVPLTAKSGNSAPFGGGHWFTICNIEAQASSYLIDGLAQVCNVKGGSAGFITRLTVGAASGHDAIRRRHRRLKRYRKTL
jgi:hypothetical protein